MEHPPHDANFVSPRAIEENVKKGFRLEVEDRFLQVDLGIITMEEALEEIRELRARIFGHIAIESA